MARLDGQTPELIRRARAGSPEALGQLLEGCRAYLQHVAHREVDPRLRAKGDASDLVQETFLEAQRDFAAFTGETEEELLAWLRHHLRYRISKFLRSHHGTAKREARREVPLEDDNSSAPRGPALVSDQPSPSECALAGERDQLLERAIGQLPEEYRRVIDLRYRQGLPFEAIGAVLGRTENSARKLWGRAIERLGQELRAKEP
jgi:RNA polymerase sigma-70 factor (ECF subfamily)